MKILNDLLDSLSIDAPVRTVLVGVHWTVVCSRFCGMASTSTSDKPHTHDSVNDVGWLHLKSARALAEFARSDNLLEASIGIAAINSLLVMDENRSIEVNAVDLLVEHSK